MRLPEKMLIYNLFPLLAGPVSDWSDHLARAAAMGYNWLFLNPLQRLGASGSLYSIADYHDVNPIFLNPKSKKTPAVQLKDMVRSAERHGLRVMVDLVVNHCSVDSDLIRKHPAWFEWDGSGRVVNPFCFEENKKVVWRDLAKIDHRQSRDREGLYRYFLDVVLSMVGLGFKGFRCDAAYQVPSDFWRRLIADVKRQAPDVLFLAETLGCPPDQTRHTAKAGFDYIFNSSKWWDFRSPWLMAQYAMTRETAPSISFPESHDTARLCEELHGNLAGMRQRYLFAAMFSAGVMMPVGFEFGFHQKLHVVRTRPADWENTGVDLTEFITSVNRLKAERPVLCEEAITDLRPADNPNVLLMWKSSIHSHEELLLILNKDIHHNQYFRCENLQHYVQAGAPLVDVSPGDRLAYLPAPFEYDLQPGQGLVLMTRRDPVADE